MLPAVAKNKLLWHLTVFPLHPLTTELAVARQRLKIGSKEGMVNRLGPEPRLFLLRLSLIHLTTSHFSKDASQMVPVSAPLWGSKMFCFCPHDRGTTQCGTVVMFAFKQTWQHLFWSANLFMHICPICLLRFSFWYFYLHLFSRQECYFSPI